jgi:hypothetical protein
MSSLLEPLKDLVRVIRNFECGDYSPIMDELFDAEDAIKSAGWTKVEDALPEEYGRYLVYRGHWYMGTMSYEIAVTDFNPKGAVWFDRGFVYTHWSGPLSKPTDANKLPILVEEDPRKTGKAA